MLLFKENERLGECTAVELPSETNNCCTAFFTHIASTAVKTLLLMTRFRVFGGGWLQSTTFLGSFSFHDYSVFIGFYASLYIGNEETYKTF